MRAFAFFFLYFGAMSGSSSGVCVPPCSSFLAGCSGLKVKSRAPRRQRQRQQPSLDHSSCEGKNCSPLNSSGYIHSHCTHSSRGQRRDLLGPILGSLPLLLCCCPRVAGSFVFGRFSFCPRRRLRSSSSVGVPTGSSINNSPLGRFLPDVRRRDCVTLELRTVKSSIIARSPVAVSAFSTLPTGGEK